MALVSRSNGRPLDAAGHVGHYGPGRSMWDDATGEHFIVYDRVGVLVDHLQSFQAAGGTVRTSPVGTVWAVLPDGRVAGRVLCGEVIPVYTEDGESDGRCGLPVKSVSGWCEVHEP